MTKLLRLTDLIRPDAEGRRRVPVSKATLYRYINEGKFPQPRKIGRTSIWTEEDLNSWKAELLGVNDVQK